MIRYFLPILTLLACNADNKSNYSSYAEYESGYGYSEPSYDDDYDWEESYSEDTGMDGEESEETPAAGQLTAGEWNDIEHWDFWLDLTANPDSEFFQFPHQWGLYPDQKVEFSLFDGDKPAVDTKLRMLDHNGDIIWKSRTNNHGIAQLFPTMLTEHQGPYSVEIETQDGIFTYGEQFSLPVHKSLAMEIEALPTQKIMDIMFMIDTTGSMCDELSYLQAELESVLTESKEIFQENALLRSSVNFYRDHGDDYVLRSFEFSDSISTINTQLNEQSCGGGGDFPEAVAEALDNAILGHSWSPSAQARILFLVLDAPPHNDPESRSLFHNAVQKAAEKGIQIIPVASSGIDKDTEFFLRSIDIATNGTYVFLTDHSGIGGEHLKASVGDFEVRPFNELLIDLILDASIIE